MFGIPSPAPSVSRESSVTEPPASAPPTTTTTAQRILLPPTVSEQRRSLSRAQVQPQQQGVTTAGRRVVRPIGAAPPLSLPRGAQGSVFPPTGGITEALQKALSSFASLGDGNADTTTTSSLLGRPSATLVDEAPHRLLFIIDQLAQELHKERSIRRCYQQQVVPLLLKKIDELEHVERDAVDRLVDLQRTVERRMTELRSVHAALRVDTPSHRDKQQQEDFQMLCGEARELLNTLWENVR